MFDCFKFRRLHFKCHAHKMIILEEGRIGSSFETELIYWQAIMICYDGANSSGIAPEKKKLKRTQHSNFFPIVTYFEL